MWLSNDPETSQALMKADADYRTAVASTVALPAEEKARAISDARRIHREAYASIIRNLREKKS